MEAARRILESPEHNATLVGKAEAKLIPFAKGLEEMPRDVLQNTRNIGWLLHEVKMAHSARVVRDHLPRASWQKYTETDVDSALVKWIHEFKMMFISNDALRPNTRKRLRDHLDALHTVYKIVDPSYKSRTSKQKAGKGGVVASRRMRPE